MDQLANNVQGKEALRKFLQAELPDTIPFNSQYEHITTREDFVKDVMEGVDMATSFCLCLVSTLLMC